MNREKDSGYYDGIYATSPEYQKENPKDSIYYPVWAEILGWLHGTMTICELGCGNGLFAQLVMAKGLNYTCGMDFSEEAIKLARKNNPGNTHKFYVEDVYTHGVNMVNTVICLETLEHLEDDLRVINRLPEETRFIFSVPDFMCDSHVRCFANEQEIMERYPMLIIGGIEKIQVAKNRNIYIVDSIRR